MVGLFPTDKAYHLVNSAETEFIPVCSLHSQWLPCFDQQYLVPQPFSTTFHAHIDTKELFRVSCLPMKRPILWHALFFQASASRFIAVWANFLHPGGLMNFNPNFWKWYSIHYLRTLAATLLSSTNRGRPKPEVNLVLPNSNIINLKFKAQNWSNRSRAIASVQSGLMCNIKIDQNRFYLIYGQQWRRRWARSLSETVTSLYLCSAFASLAANWCLHCINPHAAPKPNYIKTWAKKYWDRFLICWKFQGHIPKGTRARLHLVIRLSWLISNLAIQFPYS